MFIKYDEFELLELFLNEPESLTGDMEDGEVSYTAKVQSGFELTVFIHTYQLECEIYLSYKDKDIFSAVFQNVSKIIKKDSIMSFESDAKEIAEIYFGDLFNVRVK